MTTQLVLSGFEIEDTSATLAAASGDRDDRVTMCSQCGVIVACPIANQSLIDDGSPMGHSRLDDCPRCGGETWWDQQLPVSVLRRRTVDEPITSARLVEADRAIAGTWIHHRLIPADESTRIHAVKVIGLLAAEVAELYDIIDQLTEVPA